MDETEVLDENGLYADGGEVIVAETKYWSGSGWVDTRAEAKIYVPRTGTVDRELQEVKAKTGRKCCVLYLSVPS